MIAAILAAAVAVAPLPEGRPTWLVGVGQRSCAFWLSNHTTTYEGGLWIYGFWSALNMSSGSNPMVGSTSDGEAILGEIKKVCEADPALPLPIAVSRVYYAFAASKR